jgi:ribosomal protein L19
MDGLSSRCVEMHSRLCDATRGFTVQVLEREQVRQLQQGKKLPDFRSGDILEVTTVGTARSLEASSAQLYACVL